MLLFRVLLHLDAGQRARVMQSLGRIVGPTRALPGCVSCHLFADAEEENAILFIEEWQTQQNLETRLRADSMRTVMAAMDCAVGPPDVRVETISGTRGMDLIAACRGEVV